LQALHRSHSGKRLATLTESAGPEIEWWFDNTTPITGARSTSVVEPDIRHVKDVLAEQKPDYVVAAGKQAASVLRQLEVVPLMVVPHPAYRLLTDDLYWEAGQILRAGLVGCRELRQERGEVRVLYA
jgi:hypothetical protein